MTEGWQVFDPVAARAGELEEYGTQTWRPEPGQTLEGVITRRAEVTTKYGDTEVLEVEDDNGNVWTVWCSNVRLSQALAQLDPTEGDRIRIRYDGPVDAGKGRTLREYRVAVLPAAGGSKAAPMPQSAALAPMDDDGVPDDDMPF